MTKNQVFHKRTKHIDVKYHFVRERVETGEIKVEYIPTDQQLADIFTKPLQKQRFETLRDKIMGLWNYTTVNE
jgi:methyl coenzyme M reductase subunit D